MLNKYLSAAALTIAFAATTPAFAANASNGADLFENNCSDCHGIKDGGTSRKGPTLFGVVGRKAATVAGFDYSDAMKASGWVWSTDKLEAYLTDPKKAVPGNAMKFKGTLAAGERADIIAYLATLHK